MAQDIVDWRAVAQKYEDLRPFDLYPEGFAPQDPSSQVVPSLSQEPGPSAGASLGDAAHPVPGSTAGAGLGLSPQLPKNLAQWEPIIEKKARQYGVDPMLVRSVIWQESRGNAGAKSHVGAIGLMQLMPDTAAQLGVDPNDPEQNIDGGVRYLKEQLDRFGPEGGVAAYNAGPGNVHKYKGIPPFAETQDYVRKVLGTAASGQFVENKGHARPLNDPKDRAEASPPVSIQAPPAQSFGEKLLGLFEGTAHAAEPEAPRTQVGAGGANRLGAVLDATAFPQAPTSVEPIPDEIGGRLATSLAAGPAAKFDAVQPGLVERLWEDYKQGSEAERENLRQGGQIGHFGQPITPKELEGMERPQLEISPYLEKALDKTGLAKSDNKIAQGTAGFLRSLAKNLEGLTSGNNLAMLAVGGAAPKLVTAASTPMLATGAYESGKAGIKAAKEGDVAGAAENFTSTLLQGLFAYGAGKHAIGGELKPAGDFLRNLAETEGGRLKSVLGNEVGAIGDINPLKRSPDVPGGRIMKEEADIGGVPAEATASIPPSVDVAKQEVAKPAGSGKLSKFEKEAINQLRGEIESAEAGKRIFKEKEPGQGGDMDVSAQASTFPIENLGTKEQQLRVIDKALAGEKLTENQQYVIDEMRKHVNERFGDQKADFEASQGMKERGFVKTIREAEVSDPKVANQIRGEYRAITNKETLDLAQRAVKSDPIAARDEILDTQNLSATDTVTGIELMRHFREKGDVGEQLRIGEHLAERLTKQGQSIQAASIYSRLGPDGILRFAIKTVRKVRDGLGKEKTALLEKTAKEMAAVAAKESGKEPNFTIEGPIPNKQTKLGLESPDTPEPDFKSTGPVPTKQTKLDLPKEDIPEHEFISEGPVPNIQQELIKTPEVPEPDFKSTGPVPDIQTDMGFKPGTRWQDFLEPAAKKLKMPHVSEELAVELQRRAGEIEGMPEGRPRAIATQEMLKLIYDQVPSGLGKKISAVQTMGQLLNPKTILRNIVGNTGFSVGELASDTIATGADFLTGLVTGKRTKSLPDVAAGAKGFVRGAVEGVEETSKGINLGPGRTQFDLPDTATFKGSIGGSAEKVLNYALRVPDRAAYQAAYDMSLSSQLRSAAKGRKGEAITEPTPEMKEIAHSDALYKTFQDDNATTWVFTKLKKAFNAGQDFGVGDFVLKYPKTPANLLNRGIAYSPAGFLNTVYQAARPLMGKAFNQKAFVESFARATVGTGGLVGTGALMHRLGIITGKPEKDKDIRGVERASGLGSYRINVSALKRFALSGGNPKAAKLEEGDKLISYDWFQPFAVSLSIGAALDASGGKPGLSTVAAAAESFKQGVNTLGEQPLISGLTRTIGQGGRGLAETGIQVVKDAPSSFVPTLLKQINQYADNTARETSDENPFIEGLNQVKSKIPGLAQTLRPKIDVFGKEQEVFQEGGNSFFNVFINPAITSKFKPSPEAQMVLDLYEQTGEKKQAPVVVGKKATLNGKEIVMTPEEREKMQRYVGTLTSETFRALANDKRFNELPADEKVNELSSRLTEIGKLGKVEVLGQKFLEMSGSEGSVDRALTQQEIDRAHTNAKAEDTYEQVRALKTPEEKKAKLAELKKEDPDLFKKVKSKAKEASGGLDYEDRKIKSLGVENKSRAQYFVDAISVMGQDEKLSTLRDWREKKLLTKKVIEQMKELKANPNIKPATLNDLLPKDGSDY